MFKNVRSIKALFLGKVKPKIHLKSKVDYTRKKVSSKLLFLYKTLFFSTKNFSRVFIRVFLKFKNIWLFCNRRFFLQIPNTVIKIPLRLLSKMKFKLNSFFIKTNAFFVRKTYLSINKTGSLLNSNFTYLRLSSNLFKNTSLVFFNFIKKFKFFNKKRRFFKETFLIQKAFIHAILNLIFFKNLHKLNNLLSSFFFWRNFKKHKLIFYIFKRVFKFNNSNILGIYNFSGIKCIFKGKLSSIGGSKKRVKSWCLGNTSTKFENSHTYMNNILCTTPTGVITLKTSTF